MKSQFLLAFNEICESRNLPKDEVFEALKTALVSAYRRNTNVGNTQEVVVEIDPRTGEPTIYAEKETVDSIIDNRTEVLLEDAHRRGHPDAQLGDMLMIESTPANFGRIAAQTAKQVLLQRVREAEREQLFEDFSAREGEIVNGTVQSISGQHITIGLGRTEAILPKGQQVPGERYRAHDKIRVYVLEVRRTNRGPQIIVSRNHRNLLRRLLELEVPEIYNGQVDIKSIAREAGARSKVAVMALQPGVDPVGACVGMRGVRIQSIVRELNDEKIDVIEWDADQKTFIAKALSPARVSQVFLEEHPDDGKTAIVIVPDDQLSLAIGREGQNARLAAKLTGWRIDIKSLTESANESMGLLDHPSADPSVVGNEKLVEQARHILEKKAAGRPITAEDYGILNRVVAGVIGQNIASRASTYEKIRRERAAARAEVPEGAWDVAIDELGLSNRVYDILYDNGHQNIGDVLYLLALDENQLLGLEGFGEKALEELKEMVAEFDMSTLDRVLEEAAEDVTTEATPEAVADAADEAAPADEAPAPPPMPITAAAPEAEETAPAEGETPVAEPAAPAVDETPAEEAVEAETVVAEPVVAEVAAPEAVAAEAEAKVDAPEAPAPKKVKKPTPKKAPKPQAPTVVLARPVAEEPREDEPARRKQKGKQLVFDEEAGRVIVRRKRKRGRQLPSWEESIDEEFDLDALEDYDVDEDDEVDLVEDDE